MVSSRQRGRIPPDTFAARLRLARMVAGDISIREAAPLCGLNYGSWTGWERGAMPRDLLGTVEKISAGLNIDREWLLFGGPLAEAEENRDRWRPQQAGGVTPSCPTRSLRTAASVPLVTRPGDRRPANRADGIRLVAA